MLYEILQSIDTGNTTWILISFALVFLMTPGLALFYGGLVRKKNVLAMFAYILATIIVISLEWVLLGYSMAFGPSIGGFVGNLKYVGLTDIITVDPIDGIAFPVFVIFEMAFCIITAAILISPFTDRTQLLPFMLFIFVWAVFIYNPVAHWFWSPEGWFNKMGVIDFAGGIVVHINVGMSALAVALVIGPRIDFKKYDMEPHNVPMVLLGLGLLWFGWFGFNGGSALAAGNIAGLAILNTNTSAAAAAMTWIILDYANKQKRKTNTIGIATGALIGLASVTQSAGVIQPWVAILIGSGSTIVAYFVLEWRSRSNLDETLDAFACHGIGGIMGAIFTAVFASVGATSLITGDVHQFMIQLFAAGITAVYAFVGTYVIAFVIDKTIGFRVSSDAEYIGLDIAEHEERAYVM